MGRYTTPTYDPANVAITGGSVVGITDLAVADGGTASSTAANARTALGLGTIATQAANSVTITGGSVTGTDVTATDLKSASTTVAIDAATAPTDGQVLTASSGTVAAWVTPSGGGNTANLLAAITPTKTDFTINPATDAEITSELGVATLTTSGTTAGIAQPYLIYDLGSSKRIITSLLINGLNIIQVDIQGSDNNTDYFQWSSNPVAGLTYAFAVTGKARYIKYIIYTSDALNMNGLALRAYAI